MDHALLRRVAALQAKSILLHDQSEVLSELTDMQALRGFKSGLAEYISDHAQKGTLPPDPLTEVRERLKLIIENLDRIRDQESVIEDLSKYRIIEKRIVEEVQEKLDACRSALCQMHVDLFEGSLAEDWDGEVGDRRICPEIRECAAVLFPGKELEYRESSLKESTKTIDELSLRVGELRELHAAQSAIADEASALLKNQDFRSAISLLQEHKMISGMVRSGFTSAIKFKDISVPVSEINDLDSICRDLDRHLKKDASKLRDARVRDRGRKLVQHTRHLITSPDGEFACEANPLIAQLEEQIRVADTEAKVADARKKTIFIGLSAVMALVLVFVLLFAFLLEHSDQKLERKAEQVRLEAESKAEQARLQARLEAERESERRSLALLSVREEFRLAQAAGGPVVAWGSNLNAQTTVPAGLEDVVQISCGGYHSLVLRKDGKVVAWGDNDNGQTTVPAGLEGVVQIAAGSDHSLALKRKR